MPPQHGPEYTLCQECKRPVTPKQTFKFTREGGKIHYYCDPRRNPAGHVPTNDEWVIQLFGVGYLMPFGVGPHSRHGKASFTQDVNEAAVFPLVAARRYIGPESPYWGRGAAVRLYDALKAQERFGIRKNPAGPAPAAPIKWIVTVTDTVILPGRKAESFERRFSVTATSAAAARRSVMASGISGKRIIGVEPAEGNPAGPTLEPWQMTQEEYVAMQDRLPLGQGLPSYEYTKAASEASRTADAGTPKFDVVYESVIRRMRKEHARWQWRSLVEQHKRDTVGNPSGPTFHQAVVMARAAGAKIGDTSGFGPWLVKAGLNTRGPLIRRELESAFWIGVERGAGPTHKAPVGHAQVWQTEEGWKTAIDPESIFDTKDDAESFVKAQRRNPQDQDSPRYVPAEDDWPVGPIKWTVIDTYTGRKVVEGNMWVRTRTRAAAEKKADRLNRQQLRRTA